MQVELGSWPTPDFVPVKMPVRARQEGFTPDAAPKWHVRDVDTQTLSDLCDEFRRQIFEKAGKPDPWKRAKWVPNA